MAFENDGFSEFGPKVQRSKFKAIELKLVTNEKKKVSERSGRGLRIRATTKLTLSRSGEKNYEEDGQEDGPS